MEPKSENNATSYPFLIESELMNKYKLVEGKRENLA